MDWIYLSKNGSDEYINRLAGSDNTVPTPQETFDYDQFPNKGLVIRGIMKHKLIKQCWQDNRPFRYMDSGYFGNKPHPTYNPGGWKVWHRITENDLQQKILRQCPSDRWGRLELSTTSWRRTGRSILIVAPDEKPCVFYDINLEQWIKDVRSQLEAVTDRPIIVRQRSKDIVKLNRSSEGSFQSALEDVHAVVTFNSNAAVESIMSGVPVFLTHDVSSARAVANWGLSKIDTPWLADADYVQCWLHNLAYSQFHNRELEDGTALRIMQDKQNWPVIPKI